MCNDFFRLYKNDCNGLVFNKETINGELVYRCYYDYVDKLYCSCIECIDCLKNECKIMFNKFNVITGSMKNFSASSCMDFNRTCEEVLYLLENGCFYDEDITDRAPILVEMELFTGDYIKKIVPASYIIKMLDYKGGENDD